MLEQRTGAAAAATAPARFAASPATATATAAAAAAAPFGASAAAATSALPASALPASALPPWTDTPLSWTLSSRLAQWGPALLHWFYAQGRKTGLDSFLMGPSGYGYILPGNMSREP